MPLYEIEHFIHLGDAQKEDLAGLITRIHSRIFCTPSLFVNVRFLSKSQSTDQTFVGGKKRNINRIIAHLRSPGAHRTQDDHNRLCDALTSAWNRVVGADPYDGSSSNNAKRPTELHGIFVMGSIIAGTEAGFRLPLAGEDRHWLRANVEKFQERATYGDQDFRDLLLEMRNREDLQLRDGEGQGDGPPAYSH